MAMEQKNRTQKWLSKGPRAWKLFLVLNTVLWGVIGGVICLVVLAVVSTPVHWSWLICGMGYPAVVLGFWGGVIYLYLHTDHSQI